MSRPAVSIIVLNWNQRDLLERCLTSVAAQRYPHQDVTVIDNASGDGSADMVSGRFPAVRLLRQPHNSGYAAGHNRGIRETRGEHVLLLNADVALEPAYVDEMVRTIEADPGVGMVQGKLYQMSPAGARERRLDSVGLVMRRDRRSALRGYGELDEGQYDTPQDIFAPDGAAPLYRRAMLDDICVEGAYFDEAFFMYREEIDLGWRARWRGWRAVYAPRAVGYHVRRYAPGQRRQQPRHLRRLQWRNRYCMLLKNEAWETLGPDLWPLAWLELRAFAYSCVIEPHYLAAYAGAVKLAPAMWRQRRQALPVRRVAPDELARWFRSR